jgi:hypothetical protein
MATQRKNTKAPTTTTTPAVDVGATPAPTTPPAPVVVVRASTPVAVATVAAIKARHNGSMQYTPTMRRTLQALCDLGAVDAQTAVLHGTVGRMDTLAGRTGRNKGNQLRPLAECGAVVTVNASPAPRTYVTPVGLAAIGK